MRRLTITILLLLGVLWAASALFAQEITPVPIPPPMDAVPATAADPLAPVDVALPPGAEQLEALPTLINARADLELLATTALPTIDRPAGWSGSTNTDDSQYALLLRLDLEILAGTLLGADVRPPGWFGVVATKPLALARDIRHDLELLADNIMGTGTVRPSGWTGDDPLMRCSRATQALVTALSERPDFALSVDFTQPDYCAQVELQASVYVETNILQPPVVTQPLAAAPAAPLINAPYEANGPFTVGFFDRNARQRGGVIPEGTQFTLVGRSYTPGSNMMLVDGGSFRLFVDYLFTNVTDDEFEALSEVGEFEDNTNCQAEWCETRR